MNVLDLFSGIGGFSLGLNRAGMKTIAFCEIEEFPRKVLAKHWPNVLIFRDIKELHATDITEPIDLICGGYPCQPFSQAGKRQGQADDRHLWPEMFRIIREIRPTWVIAENVAGHVSMGLDSVLSDLESEGYQTTAFVIPACALNAPHRRDRVWVVAHNESRIDRGYYGEQEKRQGTKSGKSIGNQFDPNTKRGIESQRRHSSGVGREREQNPWDGTSWLEVATRLCGVDDGIPRKLYRNQRLKALGNSVVPQIPELIGMAIMEIQFEIDLFNL